jgi:hypothetical protein
MTMTIVVLMTRVLSRSIVAESVRDLGETWEAPRRIPTQVVQTVLHSRLATVFRNGLPRPDLAAARRRPNPSLRRGVGNISGIGGQQMIDDGVTEKF